MSAATSLVEQLKRGLDAPICLTWELTYACNLQCVHCLSSSGQRDPRELTTAEAKRVLDELRDLQVFYINIGGGEPMVRRDFFELVDYAIGNGIGVKFSTNGAFIDADKAARLAAMDYLDIQISLDGIDAATNDAGARRRLVRHGPPGDGQPRRGRASARSRSASSSPATTSTSSTGSRRSPTRTARSCASPACARPAAAPTVARPAPDQRPAAADLPLAAGQGRRRADRRLVLPPQRARRKPLPGLNMCGAGRVVCLIDPIGDVYACPFVIHDQFKAGSVRDAGGFAEVWKHSELFARAARAAVGRRLRQLRQLRRLPGRVHGRQVLHRAAARRARPGVRQRPRRHARSAPCESS